MTAMKFKAPIILMVFLLCFPSLAKEIALESADKSYVIGIHKDKLTYKGRDFKLKIDRKKCNREVFDQFAYRVNKKSKSLPAINSSAKQKQSLHLKVDGEEKLFFNLREDGRYFRRMPSNVKNLWYTSKRLCKNEKK